ncbi:GTD-binding domain [Dillenia turbinata]|uniref:GTD-binding domain n=1 Tax=Dillenia turbinata TaxID=194707 RepID=A0AAN8UAU7_9MAGN
MAANKFATMLCRNTHRITVVLVYAVLEWILIILLLLNSLFSYLIEKFAIYFGLKPPCLWCSRVDHILEPGKSNIPYRHLTCETHATEISNLGYCQKHQKLAESLNMCEDCSSSQPHDYQRTVQFSQRIAFFPWESTEDDEKQLKCSCCNESLSSKVHPPCLLVKPSWGALDYAQKGNLIIQHIDEDENGGTPSDHVENDCKVAGKIQQDEAHKNMTIDEHQVLSDIDSCSFKDTSEENCSRSISNFRCTEVESNEDENTSSSTVAEQQTNGLSGNAMTCICFKEDESLEVINPHSDNYACHDIPRLIPVELIDASTIASNGLSDTLVEDMGKLGDQESHFETETQVESEATPPDKTLSISGKMGSQVKNESAEKTVCLAQNSADLREQVLTLEAGNISDDDGNVEVERIDETENAKRDLTVKECPEIAATEVARMNSTKSNDTEAVEGHETAGDLKEEFAGRGSEEFETTQAAETIMADSRSVKEESTQTPEKKNATAAKPDDKAAMLERKTFVEKKEPIKAEDEKFPDTPTSMESLHHLHKKLLLFEKKELGTEESLDGSVMSEMEGNDGFTTLERLKSVLKAEQKALHALYAELEEERNASAIAANQTMAMITRLQEEKAAMQMEALQYQRMMEEQSEYDQESLQLLNELMTKRDKEKQELEKELEIYRKRVLEYEAKEKTMRKKKEKSVRSGNSSASLCNTDDSDDLSIDLNQEAMEQASSLNDNSPADCVANLGEMELECVKHLNTLDESLVEFELERQSILDQLKALEEKLFNLGDDEEQIFADVRPIDDYMEDYSAEIDENIIRISEENSEDFNGKYFPGRKTIYSKAKRLLPSFDATGAENEERSSVDVQVEFESDGMQNAMLDLESKKQAIEEEVDHVYERLQALEADREFLKHCIGSLKKGDKGMDLLQEILQHLRDLRNVELRVKNMGDNSLVRSFVVD